MHGQNEQLSGKEGVTAATTTPPTSIAPPSQARRGASIDTLFHAPSLEWAEAEVEGGRRRTHPPDNSNANIKKTYSHIIKITQAAETPRSPRQPHQAAPNELERTTTPVLDITGRPIPPLSLSQDKAVSMDKGPPPPFANLSNMPLTPAPVVEPSAPPEINPVLPIQISPGRTPTPTIATHLSLKESASMGRAHVARLVDQEASGKRHRRRKPTAFISPPHPGRDTTRKTTVPKELVDSIKQLGSPPRPNDYLHPELPPGAADVSLSPPGPPSPMSDTDSADWMASQSGWERQFGAASSSWLKHIKKKRGGRQKEKSLPTPKSPPLTIEPSAPVRVNTPPPPSTHTSDSAGEEWELIYGKQDSALQTLLRPGSSSDSYAAELLLGSPRRRPVLPPRVRFRPEVVEIEPSESYVDFVMRSSDSLEHNERPSKAREGARRLLRILKSKHRRQDQHTSDEPDTILNIESPRYKPRHSPDVISGSQGG
eukprot:Blabericola_migrator_1__1041@NODE_1264_length_4945_cov_61_847683_g854_i0_p1_GENE_NODE_1264_length_4945_cov_61_847683_g854_i0NODE_1264_length_4945_cov_61_847683_g854_i0_p1_ORF_typecomplete_len484_score57_88_NODE_1264_length_4945_cov_61_847683_g854_i021853636